MLVQWLLLQHLTLWGAAPDAVLLALAWMALQVDRRTGSLIGFGLGLALDIVYGTWGLHMLVKTLIGFVLGAVTISNDRGVLLIEPRQAFIGGLVLALLHNGVLVLLLALQAQTTNTFLVTSVWLGSAVYTAAVAVLAAALYNEALSR